MNNIYTGNYFQCKAGNLISISLDKGEDAGFEGRAMLEFAPQKEFFKTWRKNRGVIPEEDNNWEYVNKYYRQVLSKIDILELLKNEVNPILLCYEKDQEFCHRHILAEYIELMYDKKVRDIKIDEKLNIEENERPKYIKPMLYRGIIENILVPDSGNIDMQTLNKNKKLMFKIIPELQEEDGFDQKSPWHIYDVWEHTAVATSNSEPDNEVRTALLLHDIGKPSSYQDDGDVRHFNGHAEKSAEIAEGILKRLGYKDQQVERICYLIKNHSTVIDTKSVNENNIELTKKLLEVQYCDANAYNPEYSGRATKRLDEIKTELDKIEQEIVSKEK